MISIFNRLNATHYKYKQTDNIKMSIILILLIMILHTHGFVYNPPSCTAAPKNAIVYDFVCDYKFSKNIQSDMMAMSGNIYKINDSETDEQFALRYLEYTIYLGGTTQIITSKDHEHAVVCGITSYDDTRIVICRGTVINFLNYNDILTVLTDMDPYLINNDDLGSGTINRGFIRHMKVLRTTLDTSYPTTRVTCFVEVTVQVQFLQPCCA